MSSRIRSLPFVFVLGILLALPLVALDDSRRTSSPPRPAGSASLASIELVDVTNGFGLLLPHRVPKADAQGLPTAEIVEIRSEADLLANVRATNPILPPVQWPTLAVLPNGDAGNHYVAARFAANLDLDSFLTSAASAAVHSQLTGSLRVECIDPSAGGAVPVRGRVFVGGRTYGSPDPNDPTRLLLEQWVRAWPGGRVFALDPRGVGFPGTESPGGLAGSAQLLDPRSVVFVVDTDDDLTTHETFPVGCQVRMVLTSGIRSSRGMPLPEPGLASSTVGPDATAPEVAVSGPSMTPAIVPGNGQQGVDPETAIQVTFTEPVQLLTIGDLDDGTPPSLSAAIQVLFGPASARVPVPFTVRPLSVFDLSRLELQPTYALPGSGVPPGGIACGNLGAIDVVVQSTFFADLPGLVNTLGPQTSFVTGPGPGLVNAPVTPDAIYLARAGVTPGISVVDLNGFGAGCGNPTYDVVNPIVPGHTNFPNNPNVAIQGSLLIPPLAPGTCTVNGGSEGVFSLARDSTLGDLVVTQPVLSSAGDMALGHALDSVYRNSPLGCQSGGGNLCALTGLKLVDLAFASANSLLPTTGPLLPVQVIPGGENPVSWAPHPNPPPLVYPPLCASPPIGGQEPTSVDTLLTNLLTPGSNPLGVPSFQIPPSNLLSREQNAWFVGPSPPQATIASCSPYQVRQQIGHFLYVVDRVAGELVVLNSNRFLVLERIPLPDPTSLAMSPNLDFLAVTNESADTVSFVSVDPAASSFHRVVITTPVGRGPRGIAWEPGNEDILVCNAGDGTVSIISSFSLAVRKTVGEHLTGPFEVAITPRQIGYGIQRGVYFAYILNNDGTVAVFESGPNGINGWGFDEVLGVLPFTFASPKQIQPDVTRLRSGVWVVHENALDPGTGMPTGEVGGALANVGVGAAAVGQIPLQPGEMPGFRQLEFEVFASIGATELTGVPTDVAFDDQVNLGALPNASTAFSLGIPLALNGKNLVKTGGGAFHEASTPQFLFAPVPSSVEGPGVVDVIRLADGLRFDTDPFQPGVQSIPAPGVRGAAHFFRQ